MKGERAFLTARPVNAVCVRQSGTRTARRPVSQEQWEQEGEMGVEDRARS